MVGTWTGLVFAIAVTACGGFVLPHARVVNTACPRSCARSPLRAVCMSDAAEEMDSVLDFDADMGEDITAQIAELAANDAEPVEAVELDLVKPYLNEMALRAAIKKWQRHEGDVGSTQVQVARLSERIDYLTRHLAKNRKDKAGERGLVILANRRRRLLKYLLNEDQEMFEKLSQAYGIRTKKIVAESLGVTRRAKSRTGGEK